VRKLTAFTLTLTLALPVAAGEKSTAENRAKAIAPFLDEQTIAVAHVDLTRFDLTAFLDKVTAGGRIDQTRIGRAQATAWLDRFTKAGGKDLYLVLSLADLPQSAPFVIVPLGANADARVIANLLGSGQPAVAPGKRDASPVAAEVCEAIDGVVFAGSKAERQRLRTFRAAPRPDLAKAFSAAGDTTAQVILLSSNDIRRAIQDTLPQLPGELGGGPSTVLTRGLRWAALGIDATPKMNLRLVIQSQDAKAAQQLEQWIAAAWKLYGEKTDVRKALPQFDQLAKQFTPQVTGDRLTLALDDQAMMALAVPAVLKAQTSAERMTGANNLKQIGLALHGYHDVHKAFPAQANFSKDGKPLLSWRVHLLPFVEQEALYKEFHLDEPWDSEHNKKLIAKIPGVYRSSAKLAKEGKTSYLGNAAEHGMFGKEPVAIKEVTDGTANTLFVVDAADERAVVWTKPDDLKPDPAKPLAGLLGRFQGGFNALFVDGSVRFIGEKVDPQTLNALFTRDGGEVLGRIP
jgi:prepilin-type processing-associated H-X9-DG protein